MQQRERGGMTGSSFIHRQVPATVVIFRALQLGDMLCAVPAFRAMRRELPSAHIALVGLPWAGQFVQRFHAYIDEFIAFPGHADFPEQAVQEDRLAGFYAAMRSRRFDLAIQLHGAGPQSTLVTRAFGARRMVAHGDETCVPGEHFLPYPGHGTEVQRLLKLLASAGVAPDGDQLEFPVTTDDEGELAATSFPDALGDRPYICIHPGARRRDKCWHPARFAAVADTLAQEFKVPIVLTGSAQEADLAGQVIRHMTTPAINTTSAMSIGAMAAIFRRAGMLIANDTGVSHLAAALRLPSVIIFSKADIGRWSPGDKRLHRCLWDPDGERLAEVVQHARELWRRNA
ncbi:glycosyltransferase family 9 protein [Massilia sp. PAMC28688]|uniref:glycosyltransferase family 9 protein n=1 Tax=Massilia sp. PAMC28688 TaxID=2861283 RepID=UPI001E446C1E|nr:glycosyltransferase family 9 protein [Massilia sp. PAMC28688]